MESLVYTPAYELFFVLEPLRESIEELISALSPLSGDQAPRVLGADVYYRRDTDVALAAIRFDERQLTYRRLNWVLQLATGAGLPVLDPARLGDEDRRAFYQSYLDGYETRIEDRQSIDEALAELADELKIARAAGRLAEASEPFDRLGNDPPPASQPPASPPPASQPPISPPAVSPFEAVGPIDGDDGDKPIEPPTLAVPPPEMTPLPEPPLAGEAAPAPRRPDTGKQSPPPIPASHRAGPPPANIPPGRGALGKLAPGHCSPAERQQLSLSEQAALVRSRALNRAGTVRADLNLPDSGSVTSAMRAAAHPERAERPERHPTVPARPLAKTPTMIGPPSPSAHESAPSFSSVPPGVSGAIVESPPRADSPGSAIDVRFLRGGQWVPARLRSLSAKGAYLVTGAPPRLGDSVHIALGYEDVGAMVRGHVHHVTTAEDAVQTGSSGFAVQFPRFETPARKQLIDLLKRARADGVVIKPPPPRGSVRFPVHWPVRVGTSRGGIRADALDVSLGGMFVSTHHALAPDDELVFRLPLDVQDAPIQGRARIVRSISEQTADSRGLTRGYGLRIVELSETDGLRYRAFLDRVRRRTEKRVVVGASSERLEELTDGLSSVGYSVTAGSDPGVLVRLADFEPRPPDVAVLDASLTSHGMRGNWLEQVFTTRHVPCITTAGETAERTRAVVDRLMQVAT